MFTDTHCHIIPSEYPNCDEIIKNLKKNNIKRIIINGYNYKTNAEVINLCNKYDNVYGAIGLHPDEIGNSNNEILNQIEQNINNKKIVAIGEIGLDYYHNDSNKIDQLNIFNQLLKIAKKHNKPVIIHSRKASQDIIKSLKGYHLKGVIHCFTDSLEIANEYLKLGFYLGINGVITFKNCKLADIIVKIPINNIVLETDSPYLSPVPVRGKINEPKNVNIIANFVAEKYQMDIDKLSKIIAENESKLFDMN